VMPTVAASWSSMLIHSWSGVYMVVMGVGLLVISRETKCGRTQPRW
jgi:hypothetical protein